MVNEREKKWEGRGAVKRAEGKGVGGRGMGGRVGTGLTIGREWERKCRRRRGGEESIKEGK